MTLKIKQVNAADIMNLRHRVLRPGKPLSSAHFEGDHHKESYHFAAFWDASVVGCVSLMLKTHTRFNNKRAYQLRGMAVESSSRNNNVGHKLLMFSENQLKKNTVDLIWCNVRTSAINFYNKNNYLQVGDTFEIPDVGQHVLMYKYL